MNTKPRHPKKAEPRAPRIGTPAWPTGGIALLLALQPGAGLADVPHVGPTAPTTCARIAEDAARLACYDRIYSSTKPPDDAAPNAVPTQPGAATPADSGLPKAEARPGASFEQGDDLIAFNALSRFWELTPANKRGTFAVKTYLPNYFLPFHYTSNINRAPSSPTHPNGGGTNHFKRAEAKFQISLRAKVLENVLLPNGDLWFAYTQRSLWQLWNNEDSAPFRNTDFQPEAIYVVPVPERLGEMPGGWRWRMVQLGLAHQSNGQSDPLSRSWNRVYAGTAFERGNLALQLRVSRRTGDPGTNDNPDLLRYIGNTEISAAWFPGLATATLAWRTHPENLKRGSLQLDWTYPVDRDRPRGLRWYLQLFSGYGESLLDYNHRQTSLGVGVSLFQY